MSRVLTFADEYAPVWRDPDTGEVGTWTAARFRAAGFDVRDLDHDLHAVDLDSRRAPLEPGSTDPTANPHGVDTALDMIETPPEPPMPHNWNTE